MSWKQYKPKFIAMGEEIELYPSGMGLYSLWIKNGKELSQNFISWLNYKW